MAESDTPQRAPQPALPEPVLAQQNRLHLSLVWIVPIVALVVGAVLVVRALLQTGPEITIEFRSGEGIEAGRTEVRFKEVVVGRVKSVSLVARPPEGAGHRHTGPQRQVDRRRRQPLLGGAPAHRHRRRQRPGHLAVGGLHRRRRRRIAAVAHRVRRARPAAAGAARRAGAQLRAAAPTTWDRSTSARRCTTAACGSAASSAIAVRPMAARWTFQVFIEAPFENLVTASTRFWHASGVDLSLNAGGLTLQHAVAGLGAGRRHRVRRAARR